MSEVSDFDEILRQFTALDKDGAGVVMYRMLETQLAVHGFYDTDILSRVWAQVHSCGMHVNRSMRCARAQVSRNLYGYSQPHGEYRLVRSCNVCVTEGERRRVVQNKKFRNPAGAAWYL